MPGVIPTTVQPRGRSSPEARGSTPLLEALPHALQMTRQCCRNTSAHYPAQHPAEQAAERIHSRPIDIRLWRQATAGRSRRRGSAETHSPVSAPASAWQVGERRWRTDSPDLSNCIRSLELLYVRQLPDERLWRHRHDDHAGARDLAIILRLQHPSDGDTSSRTCDVTLPEAQKLRNLLVLTGLNGAERERDGQESEHGAKPGAQGTPRLRAGVDDSCKEGKRPRRISAVRKRRVVRCRGRLCQTAAHRPRQGR